MSNVHFVVYDSTTGFVKRAGHCQSVVLEAQATKDGEEVLQVDNFLDPNTVQVNLNTLEIEAI